MIRCLLLAAIPYAALLFALPASAQMDAYPAKSIRIVVPYGAGAGFWALR